MKQSPLKIGIFGATGRLGSTIGALALKDPLLSITSAVAHLKSPHLTFDYGAFLKQNPIHIPITAAPICPLPSIFIDVSLAPAFSHNIAFALSQNIPLVVGTTALTLLDLQLMKEASLKIPLFYSANFSLSMALFHKLAALAAKLPSTEIFLTETHHTKKKDAPSGSLLALLKTIQKVNPTAKPQIESIRIGDVIGEHTLHFKTLQETLTISHQAHTRDLFANGALTAAKFLMDKPPGLYGMDDLL